MLGQHLYILFPDILVFVYKSLMVLRILSLLSLRL
nr:MAG TPA: hypothetical protein [Caudoviricetes sp.]